MDKCQIGIDREVDAVQTNIDFLQIEKIRLKFSIYQMEKNRLPPLAPKEAMIKVKKVK